MHIMNIIILKLMFAVSPQKKEKRNQVIIINTYINLTYKALWYHTIIPSPSQQVPNTVLYSLFAGRRADPGAEEYPCALGTPVVSALRS